MASTYNCRGIYLWDDHLLFFSMTWINWKANILKSWNVRTRGSLKYHLIQPPYFILWSHWDLVRFSDWPNIVQFIRIKEIKITSQRQWLIWSSTIMVAETNQQNGSYISNIVPSKITYHLGRKRSSKTEKCSSQFTFVGAFIILSKRFYLLICVLSQESNQDGWPPNCELCWSGKDSGFKRKKPYNLYSLKNVVEFFPVGIDFVLELGTSSPTGKSWGIVFRNWGWGLCQTWRCLQFLEVKIHWLYSVQFSTTFCFISTLMFSKIFWF